MKWLETRLDNLYNFGNWSPILLGASAGLPIMTGNIILMVFGLLIYIFIAGSFVVSTILINRDIKRLDKQIKELPSNTNNFWSDRMGRN